MKKRLYAAYGSNLNIEQMKHRCPTARLRGTGIVEDFELQFKGSSDCAFATIAPKNGSSVPVAIWELQPRDEAALDRYEGYPSHYFKQNVPVVMEGESISVMAYIMDQRMNFGLPSALYYRTVHDGYRDCGLDVGALEAAVGRSAQAFYSAYTEPQMHQQTLFGCYDSSDDEDEYEDEAPGFDEEPDESDPFYSSGGMSM